MKGDRVYLFDTTLRDGAQTQGVDFGVADKVAISEALDAIGIDYVEGGWPGANPTDDAFFARPPALRQARLTAFCMTRRPGRSAENDPGLAPLINRRADAPRSEEHTSQLQSLMRISSAVFCLKKKKNKD